MLQLGTNHFNHCRPAVCSMHYSMDVCVLYLQVQMLPKAALLLANAPDSDKRDRMMRYLPVWAPGTGTVQSKQGTSSFTDPRTLV